MASKLRVTERAMENTDVGSHCENKKRNDWIKDKTRMTVIVIIHG